MKINSWFGDIAFWNVITSFHEVTSMLQIVGEESLSRFSGWVKTMALFGGVADHTPQGQAWPHHDFFEMIIHNKKCPHISSEVKHKPSFLICLQLLELHFPDNFFFSINNLVSNFRMLWHRLDFNKPYFYFEHFHIT